MQPVTLPRLVASFNQRDARTAPIVSSAIEVHRQMGPGLLESAYEECLCYELSLRGVHFKRQVPIALIYKGLPLHCGYQMDLVVEEQVVVELESSVEFCKQVVSERL
ncbi:MAG TPA: GxxExxY protein [Terriglobales bacterium]|nr:GxxExxY protein [Terriglobales bacterium]